MKKTVSKALPYKNYVIDVIWREDGGKPFGSYLAVAYRQEDYSNKTAVTLADGKPLAVSLSSYDKVVSEVKSMIDRLDV